MIKPSNDIFRNKLNEPFLSKNESGFHMGIKSKVYSLSSPDSTTLVLIPDTQIISVF